jgi:hypothetical protein
MPARSPDRVYPAAVDIVKLAKKEARRRGIMLSPRTLASIKRARGFIAGLRTIRPGRPKNEEFRTLAVMRPAEWPPRLLINAHQKLVRALKDGRPVPVRVQYVDGRPAVVVMEPAPWALPAPSPTGRRPGAPRRLTDIAWQAHLTRHPVKNMLSSQQRAHFLRKEQGVAVSRSTVHRRFKGTFGGA